jgi:DNA processing protein
VSDDATEAEAWALLLAVDGLGPAALGGLLAAYGTGRGVLDAAGRRGAAASFAAIAAAAQGTTRRSAAIGAAIVALAAEPGPGLATLRASGVRIVTLDDAAYPIRLRRVELPPPVLLVRGDADLLAADHTIAIVGTRRPSERGRLVAARIAAAVSDAGGVVVSGLAVGIDGAAHAAVVAHEGRTVAVLGSGHGRLYPRAHVRLAGDVVDRGGALLSELFPDRAPTRATFPQRNRLISGLSDATIVVEAGMGSGALITAGWALSQGRDCFVVPGPVDDPRSAGCLAFYREYPEVVRLVAGIPELVADLGLDTALGGASGSGRGRPSLGQPLPPSAAALLVEVGPTARQVALALIGGHSSIDELVQATDHEPATVLGAITLLEMRGLATSTYGRYRAAGRLATLAPQSGGTSARKPRRRWPSRASVLAAAEARGLPGRREPC